MKRMVGRTISVFMMLVIALTVAAPAFAYNNVNADTLLLRRKDAVQCGTRIRLVARVVNRRGKPVKNARVNFTLKGKGGKLGPDADKKLERTVTDGNGKARPSPQVSGRSLPFLKIKCGSNPGERKVRAYVLNAGVSMRLKIYCGADEGCDGSRF